jgi:hypothetical protein
MISARKAIACCAAALVPFLAEVAPDSPLGFRLVSEAQAVVGAPLSPASVAGVARRTTRRTVAVVGTEAAAASSAQQATAQQQAATAQQQSATAAQQSATAQQQSATAQQQAATAASGPGQPLPLGVVVTALPAGCSQMSKDGVEYQKCGPNYSRTAFQGSNLVYVTAQP